MCFLADRNFANWHHHSATLKSDLLDQNLTQPVMNMHPPEHNYEMALAIFCHSLPTIYTSSWEPKTWKSNHQVGNIN